MSMNLMIVDSAAEVISAVKDIFEPVCHVAAYADGTQAAQAIARQKFGAVFLEAQPPHVDGFELARQVRRSRSNAKVPIVMVTVFYDTETMLEAFRSGVNLFLGKPVTREQVSRLFNAVHGAMLNEHRRYLRAPLKAPVRCSFAGRNEEVSAVNLSSGGMLLKSSALRMGQDVEIEFKIPQSPKPLKLRAKVVRTEPAGAAALRFMTITPDTRDVLTRYTASAAGLQLAS